MHQSLKIAFLASDKTWEAYRSALPQALARHGIKAALSHGSAEAEAADYIIYAPFGEAVDFTPFTRTKAVLSLWAGVETIVTNQSLTQPLCRMVDPSLEAGMVEYVLGHVMRHHLEMDQYLYGQDGIWRGDTPPPPLAHERKIGILGLGALGAASARKLALLGFEVHGWSRRPKTIAGITCHSGADGLDELLKQAEIVVTLLPLTAETEHLLDDKRLALLPAGAVVINPGRGKLIDEAALHAALDAGQIGHATLDVFATEPLPKDHPFWAHPKVTVTPHIAASTRPSTAVEVLAENIRRGEAGEGFLYLVDRDAGY